MIGMFYIDHQEEPITTSLFFDSSPPMAKPTIRLVPKCKQNRPAKYSIKQAKK